MIHIRYDYLYNYIQINSEMILFNYFIAEKSDFLRFRFNYQHYFKAYDD